MSFINSDDENYVANLISEMTSLECQIGYWNNLYFVAIPHVIAFDKETNKMIDNVLNMFQKCCIHKELMKNYKTTKVLFTLTASELEAFVLFHKMKGA